MVLESLSPDRILDVLNLAAKELEPVKAAADDGDRPAALAALLDVYRKRHPLTKGSGADTETIAKADRVCEHTFERLPYEPANYGEEIDWTWDPRNDIEWVATVYRFYWAAPLAQAFATTGNQKYPAAFVELTSDWIAKHPLEKRGITHPVYTHWKGFPWVDIQTGRRATSICDAFPTFIHGEAFTPEFLGILLASLYDHQVKTEHEPMGRVHNKAIFEQRGFVNICSTIPEFADTRRWMEMAISRSHKSFLEQTTSDGVQREWSFGYHRGVLHDAVDIRSRAEAFNLKVPDDYNDLVTKMFDYVYAISTPDLGPPMFGDGSRDLVNVAEDPRPTWPLYDNLIEATAVTDDPKHRARAENDATHLRDKLNYAFPEAGMYALRSGWDPDAIHLGLHCSPLAISAHDQPDNGTFELYAFGRWLMPDSGFYVYGHDKEAREWHRQTRVHNTLTIDGKDTQDAGKHLLWRDEGSVTTVVVENESYGEEAPSSGSLTHRRTVWFVNRSYFVLLDEAIGSLSGDLDLHFWFAPGEISVDASTNSARTLFDDANIIVASSVGAPVTIDTQDGWSAWKYGFRKERKGIRVRHSEGVPGWFLTVLVPYRGSVPPVVEASVVGDFSAGDDRVEVRTSVDGKECMLTRS